MEGKKMKKILTATAILLGTAGFAFAGPIGAQVNGGSGGIMNNATTVYHGASLSNAGESAVNSASNVQGGFLNNFQVAQAGDHADMSAGAITVSDEVAKISTNEDKSNINMSKMFQLMNTTNSIGD
jgi:hypothetical protein